MIDKLELLLLLMRNEQIDSVAELVGNGFANFVVQNDVVVGFSNTEAGNAKLRSVTLPPCVS
jgi:hypothetical protein